MVGTVVFSDFWFWAYPVRSIQIEFQRSKNGRPLFVVNLCVQAMYDWTIVWRYTLVDAIGVPVNEYSQYKTTGNSEKKMRKNVFNNGKYLQRTVREQDWDSDAESTGSPKVHRRTHNIIIIINYYTTWYRCRSTRFLSPRRSFSIDPIRLPPIVWARDVRHRRSIVAVVVSRVRREDAWGEERSRAKRNTNGSARTKAAAAAITKIIIIRERNTRQ